MVAVVVEGVAADADAVADTIVTIREDPAAPPQVRLQTSTATSREQKLLQDRPERHLKSLGHQSPHLLLPPLALREGLDDMGDGGNVSQGLP